MSNASQFPDEITRRLETGLARLAAGDPTARDELIAVACERMRLMAHRMLRVFPSVRRWDETDDVVQNASMRLYKALAQCVPQDTRGFIGLAAIQVRRELLDLARRHAGPESYAANHETNVHLIGGEEIHKVNGASDAADSLAGLDRWTRFHEVVASLPEEDRQVFDRAWYMGMKQEAIADQLECSVRTVKRRWESAKRLISKGLDGEQPG